MNYYEHHIGDYAAATAHLSLVEDAIYSRLLRRYYLEESPLPSDEAACARLAGARTQDERDAAAAVLAEFFPVSDVDGLRHNKRADAEISAYRSKIAAAIANGKRGGRPRSKPSGSENETGTEAKKTQPFPSGSENETGTKALQTPDSIQEQEQKPSGDCSPDVPTSPVPAKACEPPADPPEPPSIRRQQGCTFTTFVAECQAKGEKPIPKDHPVFRFADDARIPVEFVRLAWMEFRRDFGEGGKSAKKRQAGMRGWRQHFDNAVRKGWYRLWAFDRQGECYLTPAGVALQREAEAEARDAA